ncbi:carbohydrate kinase [Synechococcales cyanobacterium C]|uniref:Carbohydrate kinase n=1 Tax=Petrachloros mirabilis ULC683 TaxID=2781853 RepID=A0A8K1ZX94_9CYAN|nr:FGGY-family carbohydrate kinase [Petrachloros mirabilis]NCJ05558.1 carbohydrate kinase [Petrachloros mirabilis ULC683]
MPYFLGLDFGTSGARAIAIDSDHQICCEIAIPFPVVPVEQQPTLWKRTLFSLISQVPASIRSHLNALAIDGTSSTVLICDRQGQPLHPPLMYNDAIGATPQLNQLGTIAQQILQIAPTGHCVHSSSSSLAKLLWLSQQVDLSLAQAFVHQADWLGFWLHGHLGVSDYHNSLKLGYDPALQDYPVWFDHPTLNPLQRLLPQVVAPGTRIGHPTPDISAALGLPPTCALCAGTTDSIAAFLASGASRPGEAVTSLGSTLVIKLLSQQRIDQAEYGIYSHRLGNHWLVGGASNTGGAVLAEYFSPAELQAFSALINPHQPSPWHYYPLLKPGERFPINDPHLMPCLTPRPDDPVAFLHGLLESIAGIEALGYARLVELGATPPSQIYTAGGGAQNQTWEIIRHRHLGVPLLRPQFPQAAYGTALLALQQTAISELV